MAIGYRWPAGGAWHLYSGLGMTYSNTMELEYTYWEDGDGWLIGYLNIWPDHWTQGKGKPELEEMLLDLYCNYKEEQTRNVITRKAGKLRVPA